MENCNLSGTKTAENLAKAISSEAQARNRYTFFAETAEEEHLPTLQKIFLTTADEERGHGEIFYKYLSEGLGKTILYPEFLVPVGLSKTENNLAFSAEIEHLEWSELYPEFGRMAEQEGFSEIAESFFKIATIEKRHDERFRYFEQRLKTGSLFSLPREVTWVCINCGLHLKGKSAPKICPACHHPQYYYMTNFDGIYPVN